MRLKVVRALGFAAMGGLTALALHRVNYEQHRKNIALPEQTNTINLLSNSLPTRLSELLINQNTDEINKILNINSNISVVVTDCRQVSGACNNQHILFNSGDFQPSQDAQTLSLQPFNVLRDPPPLYPEWELTSRNETVQTSLSGKNEGRPIGRVYYFRDSLPSFWADLGQRFSINSADDLLDSYVLTLMLALGTSMMMWGLLEDALRNRKRTRTVRKALLAQNDQLKLDIQTLERETVKLKDKLHGVSSKILQEKSDKEQAQNSVKSLKREILSLRTQLSDAQVRSASLHAEVSELKSQKDKYPNQKSNSVQISKSTELDALRQAQIELQEKLTNREHLLTQEQKTVERLESGITSLESQLKEAIKQSQVKEELVIKLKAKEKTLNIQNNQLFEYGDDLTKKLDTVKIERDEFKAEIGRLKSDLSYKTKRIRQLESVEEPSHSHELDLSQYRLAILCGHDEDVQDISSAITQKYGECDIKTISQEQAEIPERRLKPKLEFRDCVILLTRRASHSVSGNVKSICDSLDIPVVSINQPGDGRYFLSLIEDKLKYHFGF